MLRHSAISRGLQTLATSYSAFTHYTTCSLFQIDLVLSFEELLESLHLRHRFVIKQSKTFYPNVPATLLPQWCKRGATDKEFAEDAEFGKAQKRVAKWYSKLFITDEFSTSGRNISDAIKPQVLQWSCCDQQGAWNYQYYQYSLDCQIGIRHPYFNTQFCGWSELVPLCVYGVRFMFMNT